MQDCSLVGCEILGQAIFSLSETFFILDISCRLPADSLIAAKRLYMSQYEYLAKGGNFNSNMFCFLLVWRQKYLFKAISVYAHRHSHVQFILLLYVFTYYTRFMLLGLAPPPELCLAVRTTGSFYSSEMFESKAPEW